MILILDSISQLTFDYNSQAYTIYYLYVYISECTPQSSSPETKQKKGEESLLSFFLFRFHSALK